MSGEPQALMYQGWTDADGDHHTIRRFVQTDLPVWPRVANGDVVVLMPADARHVDCIALLEQILDEYRVDPTP